jgi:hypothetical protein
MRHELAGYVAAWHPDHEYGVVMRACDNYIQSDATGTRLPEFDMGVAASHNAKVRGCSFFASKSWPRFAQLCVAKLAAADFTAFSDLSRV